MSTRSMKLKRAVRHLATPLTLHRSSIINGSRCGTSSIAPKPPSSFPPPSMTPLPHSPIASFSTTTTTTTTTISSRLYSSGMPIQSKLGSSVEWQSTFQLNHKPHRDDENEKDGTRVESDAKYESVSKALHKQIQAGELVHDEAQQRAARRLSKLQEALVGYDNTDCIRQLESYWTRLYHYDTFLQNKKKITKQKHQPNVTMHGDTEEIEMEQPKPPKLQIPKGVYIHGTVGTGKSLLADTFYQTAPVPTHRKLRIHFHSFLAQIHSQLHQHRQHQARLRAQPSPSTSPSTSPPPPQFNLNPIQSIAAKLASNTTLLCLDEFHVTDAADALLLQQLFEILWQRGTVVVFTSNRSPEDLYEGGVNRQYFINGFIAWLRRYCRIYDLGSGIDHRRRIAMDDGCEYYFVRRRGGSSDDEDGERDAILQQVWSQVEQRSSYHLPLPQNRTLLLPEADVQNWSVVRCTVSELCDAELGSSDYRVLANTFSTIVLEDVPRLSKKQPDLARRFVTLVDELYEAKCRLVCVAVEEPDGLFVRVVPAHENATEKNEEDGLLLVQSVETTVGEAFGIDVAQSDGRTAGELASVRELDFAFRRAASRLMQMCSRDWWERVGV